MERDTYDVVWGEKLVLTALGTECTVILWLKARRRMCEQSNKHKGEGQRGCTFQIKK